MCPGEPAWLSTEGAGDSVTEFADINEARFAVYGFSVQVGVGGCEWGLRGYAEGLVGVTGLLGRHLWSWLKSLASIDSTLCNTSPAPGHLSPKSAFVSRQSALPFIWNMSMSNWGRSNSRSAHRRNVATSSRDHSRGSEAVGHSRSINFSSLFFFLRLWSFRSLDSSFSSDGETESELRIFENSNTRCF